MWRREGARKIGASFEVSNVELLTEKYNDDDGNDMALATVELTKVNDAKQVDDIPIQIPQVMPISDFDDG